MDERWTTKRRAEKKVRKILRSDDVVGSSNLPWAAFL